MQWKQVELLKVSVVLEHILWTVWSLPNSDVSGSFRPVGHKYHTVMSRGPGGLAGSKRVPWLGNKDFKI